MALETSEVSGKRLSIDSMAKERERLIKLLAGVTFLIFFQAYMVAPLIPASLRSSAFRAKRSA